VALSPTISKKKKETTKSLKSFEKQLYNKNLKLLPSRYKTSIEKTKQIHRPDTIWFLI